MAKKRALIYCEYFNICLSFSGTTSQKSKIVAHGSASAHRLCTQYLDVLMAHLIEMVSECRTHLLVTSGLHTVDAWSLLMYSLISDQTLIITESNSDVWAVSSLDRIAELIRLYDVALITSNAQFLKSFVKYETEKLYGINSLKVVSYSGAPLPISVAKKFHEANGASIVHCKRDYISRLSKTSIGLVEYFSIVSPLLENALLDHPSVEDVVVAVMNDELTAGVVVKEDVPPPTLEELNEHIVGRYLYSCSCE
ncbi:hypothetical protein ANCDUO_09710 [Ancylostoma duodenale]|uniref:Uncharacterized protein n=1 Tax=Ancylostoma duodenale TaxID=51022 RepID=A0A0C2CT38_9BILA|nr:hypothetical protein ANCDUO_09710 [Ancylostoma duodenale]